MFFDATWKVMMDDYDIVSWSWFSMMHALRHKCAARFSNEVSSAGLLATSRGEGTNSALKKIIRNISASLLECVRVIYEKLQDSWRVLKRKRSLFACARNLDSSLQITHYWCMLLMFIHLTC